VCDRLWQLDVVNRDSCGSNRAQACGVFLHQPDSQCCVAWTELTQPVPEVLNGQLCGVCPAVLAWRCVRAGGCALSTTPRAYAVLCCAVLCRAALRCSNRSDPGGGRHDSPKHPAGSGSHRGGRGDGGSSGSGMYIADARGNSPPDGGQQSASFASLQPLPGSTASLDTSLPCNVLADLRFGVLLGTGSFGEKHMCQAGWMLHNQCCPCRTL
jgi:hypothetical protein